MGDGWVVCARVCVYVFSVCYCVLSVLLLQALFNAKQEPTSAICMYDNYDYFFQSDDTSSLASRSADFDVDDEDFDPVH